MADSLNTILSPYLVSLLVATGIGLIIGLEREFSKATGKDHFAGIRTFPLVAILGCVITFIAEQQTPWLLVAAVFAFMLLVAAAYYIRYASEHPGITTEISLIITFTLGAMTALHLIREALATAVITSTLLSLKGQFHTFVAKITGEELFAFIKFIVLCMLLFPFLPDKPYGPAGILNPREIGFIVVIVSSLSFASYLLMKFAGAEKGILLTAFLGGLFSSTAVTWVFSSRSRTAAASQVPLYASGIMLASSIMFLRVALVALIFNALVFRSLIIPCILMSATGLVIVFFMTRKKKGAQASPSIALSNPVNILNALGFGLLYTGIALLVFYANEYLGSRGLILSGFISGLADVDAITISMARFQNSLQNLDISVLVIVVAMISNTLVKAGISLVKGAPALRRKVLAGLGAMILPGAVYALARFV